MTLGEKLQELRRKNAMSQDVLAEKLEVSRQAVSKWERDEAMPETDKIVRIAQLFGVSTDYLLLDGQKQEPRPQYQPPQVRPATGDRLERFIRRHGYKGGYVMVAGGAVLCIIALLIFILLPQFGKDFFDPVRDFAGSMGGISWGSDILPGIDGDMAEIDGMLDGGFDIAVDGMQQTWTGTMGAMAAISGTPLLLAGIGLIALGVLVVIKGKKIAAETIG